ncbi:MAG: phosphoribosylaminoimidazolesuccinocarboxamide synthase [Ilumatobacteraceae bacterium]
MTTFTDIDLPLEDRRVGKVRVSYRLPEAKRLLVTTDRLSAFDRVVAAIPYKGQVLNQLAGWWFEQTKDVVANHVVSLPDPNALVAHEATTLPVEVIVRGYITGVTTTSLWRQYDEGARTIYGYDFPDGLEKNTRLPEPIITPTTKAAQGAHDEPLSCSDVVDQGLVEPELWDRVQAAALAIFDFGRRTANAAGLILADTKYEFGMTADGRLLLIDEVHTPDSSRFWVAETYDERLAAGIDPESLDKEPIRKWLAAAGYKGDGDSPPLPDEVVAETTSRYISAYERLTGTDFERGSYPIENRLIDALRSEGLL